MEKEGFGEEFSIYSSFCLGIGGGQKAKIQIQYCASTILLFFVHDLKETILGIRLGHFR